MLKIFQDEILPPDVLEVSDGEGMFEEDSEEEFSEFELSEEELSDEEDSEFDSDDVTHTQVSHMWELNEIVEETYSDIEFNIVPKEPNPTWEFMKEYSYVPVAIVLFLASPFILLFVGNLFWRAVLSLIILLF